MNNTNAEYYFFKGGGEMGELIRAKDWSKTPLGDPADWSQSLCTMVAVMLNNPFGMYIAWGSEYIQLYNDGYRPILGAVKHPQALGISTRETFSEIWHIIESMFDGVMNGQAVGFPDFMLPLNRNGFVEECYFDFSYSPILKNDGEVGGVLVTVIETTEKKKAVDALNESNTRYVNNILQAPVAMCIFRGKNHVVEIANEKMLQLWGKQAEQVMNKPIFEGLPEAKNQGLEELIDKVYTTGEKFVANERPVDLPRNGKMETTYVNFVYDALKEADGDISGIIATATEVTTQVEARRKIQESEEQFSTLANNILNLAWIADGAGWIYWYNKQWYEYTGTTLEEMQGWGWEKVHHPEHIERVVDFVKQAWKINKPWELVFPLRGSDGQYRTFLTRAFPVCDEEGQITHWVGTNTDIEEQKTREEKKDEFISIASHEMKTPLTTAKAYLQMLELSLNENDEDAKLFAKKASQSVNRLSDLVGELLDVSKIRLGKLNYTITTFNFNEMIESTVENVQLTSQTHTIIKTGKVLDNVTGDKDRLQQVVINLLTNAIKYSPSAESVFIMVEQEKGVIKVSVKDTGIGMSRQSLNKIFEKYHRIEEHSMHFQGLGIGLFISFEIIQRHHGKLWAESETGKGSTFYFTIPLDITSPQ